MNNLGKISVQRPLSDSVKLLTIDDASAGQRIDNFLLRICKGVPKSHIYRIVRSGEVRVNKGRVDTAYRLAIGDIIRLPPMRIAHKDNEGTQRLGSTAPVANFPVLYEDDCLLVINKPAGVAVHGGSGIAFGVIEQLRQTYSKLKFLELVHRLDRETSGILLLAKKRSALTALHAQLRDNKVDKRYLACVHADWQAPRQIVKERLHKFLTPEGERRVCIHEQGQLAHTVFNLIQRFTGYALLEAELKTGRTHQIRVHLAHLAAPIVGDDKYGDFALNRQLARAGAKPGLKRMFLHAYKVSFVHPVSGAVLALEAPLPKECERFLAQLSPPQKKHMSDKKSLAPL
ncbi:RluA family pseudouridine synthase [Mycoavidus sp. SF9855]|uniref:RluA family pseudouridine synthase n=1 Tax=Mycoavidus sp. SF9855 TaxID=2968475 RepID=UPI00211BF310|nr:RluA family pseudouridine synthase [Mycoavidus sp. SF9855]UUM21225.1 RluA family pseudouridine synthase [Mycoavidus sp. SF9855]